MIYGLIHPGSGLGNQLHRIVATKILALDKGYDSSFIGTGYFKGDFMNIDLGNEEHHYVSIEAGGKIQVRKSIPLWEEWDKYCYDPDINFVEDNSIIDGNFEDERYFEHRLPEIREWLKTEPIKILDDTCLIGFRGGEYYAVPELGLPKEYYVRAVSEMLKINPNMKFEVHTDDESLAKEFFPSFPIIRDVGINWRSMRYAKYAIIANSSFYVLPRLLQHEDNKESLTIAPRYWNRYNTKRWDYPQGYYKAFKYI